MNGKRLRDTSPVYLFAGGSGIMSWIIVTKHVRIMNLCFKNMGIMTLYTSIGSGIMNNETLRKAQQNTRMN